MVSAPPTPHGGNPGPRAGVPVALRCPVTLIARDLTVSYPDQPRGARPVLEKVCCAIAPGRITAIIGPNGAGKSTLLRALAGVRRADSGGVKLDGQAVGSMRPRDRARRIALAVQQPGVAFGFDARRVIAFGAEGSGARAGATDRAIERFQLAQLADRPFDTLSVGQRQRVSLARAFAQLDVPSEVRSEARPDAYLLADEPVSAMDPRYAVAAIGAIRDLARGGIGVAIVLHDLTAAAALADDAILLGAPGTLVAQGPAKEVLTANSLSDLFETPIRRAHAQGIGPVIGQPIPDDQPAPLPSPASDS